MNIHSSRDRDAHSGELVRLYAAICFYCRDYLLVEASTKIDAIKALTGAEWHIEQGHWYCHACFQRQQGYRELEQRERGKP